MEYIPNYSVFYCVLSGVTTKHVACLCGALSWWRVFSLGEREMKNHLASKKCIAQKLWKGSKEINYFQVYKVFFSSFLLLLSLFALLLSFSNSTLLILSSSCSPLRRKKASFLFKENTLWFNHFSLTSREHVSCTIRPRLQLKPLSLKVAHYLRENTIFILYPHTFKLNWAK